MKVEKTLHLEWIDPEMAVEMQYYDHGMLATFSGLFSDVVVENIDFAKLINPRPSSTFCIKVGGNSLSDERLLAGDRVIIDKSLPYLDGKKIAYFLKDYDGWTVKKLSIRPDGNYLIPANEKDETLKPYKIKEYDIPWGMVTWILYNEYNKKL